MTMDSRGSVNGLLSMAQNLLRIRTEESKQTVTPDMIEDVLRTLVPLVGANLTSSERDGVLLELIRRSSRSVGQIATLSSLDDHVPWLSADRKKGWTYWRRYAEYLEPTLSWSALDSLDAATDDILGNLEDPFRHGSWDRRGLVVGHVQSGKTSNYTGLICKAADAGYKIIIVLAGMHNNLRAQTQIRLDEGFLGYATTGDDFLSAVGVGKIDSDLSVRPNAATNRSERGDFSTAIAAKMNISPEQRPWLFVVKKQKTVLELLVHWIRNRAADHEDLETGRRLVASLPLLMIDDESDHGSVDTGEAVLDEHGVPDVEHEPTTINRLIRTVLHHFTRKAYVGYTATPFANIFIHDRGETLEHGPDLFPAAFITSLSAPSNYVGPGRVFGSDSTADRQPLVRVLIPKDFVEWMPNPHKSNHFPRWREHSGLPDTLQEAVRSFVYACAVRKLRGQGAQHTSMLIHVTRFTNVQKIVVEQVSEYVRDLKGRYLRGIAVDEVSALMKDEYETKFHPAMQKIRESLSDGEQLPDFTWEEIRTVLPEILEDIRIRTINGTAKDVLDYTENSANGLKVIAIGGDKLARGLTLEGLCTSYFLRTARMYDTLMQMGRWFGYRDGYLDVCRLYTTGEMIEWFGHIADAAEELRQEFDNMVAAGATPKQFGLRVKSHSVLTVTSRTKMRNARAMKFTYSGDLLQTIVFPNEKKQVSANFRAGSQFVKSLSPPLSLQDQQYLNSAQRWHGYLWRGVSSLDIISFLRSYQTHPASFRVMSPLIANFIEEMNKDRELTDWTVALIGKDAALGKEQDIEQGKESANIGGCSINMLTRGRSTDQTDRYSIKTLISPRDQAIDLSESEWKAALELTHRTWKGDRDRNQAGHPPSEPQGPQIRRVLGDGSPEHGVLARRERGLLLLYLLNPETSGCEELKGGDPVLAWAVSFPTSPSQRTVSNAAYMGNSVLWEELNDWVD